MMSFGPPLDVKTRYDAIPIKMYKIVHTIGNKMRGGNKGGLFSWSIMEKLSAVREDASSPTKSGRRTHRIKSAVFCKVVFRNRKAVKLIFGNKKSPPLIVYSVRERKRQYLRKIVRKEEFANYYEK